MYILNIPYEHGLNTNKTYSKTSETHSPDGDTYTRLTSAAVHCTVSYSGAAQANSAFHPSGVGK